MRFIRHLRPSSNPKLVNIHPAKIATAIMRIRIIPLLLIAGVILSSCGTGSDSSKKTPIPVVRRDLLASFVCEITSPLQNGTQMALEWVNPVEIHELNPKRLIMNAVDDLHYQVDVPVKKGAFLQYRYIQVGNTTAIETGSDGKPVISRFYSISNHARIQDKVLGFDSSSKEFPTGWIQGKITIQGSQQTASDILINIAGVSGVSSVDGGFQIKGIPVGTQNLTIFSSNGLFEPIQQQAVIEKNYVTPIDVELIPKSMVNVTFLLSTPATTPSNATIRLFGSTGSLGNSFAGLFGGTNPVQSSAPQLARQSGNQYILVVSLPAETEIKYHYSMGDTFWNRELDQKGNSPLRTFFVPRQDVIIEDQIVTWETPDFKPVTFQFTPPPNTEPNDAIQIQFNAFGWMEPLQMWPSGNGSYEYQLFSPLNFTENIKYRFCRSSICGTIDSETNGENIGSFQAASEVQVLQTSGTTWKHLSVNSEPTVVSTESTSPKPEGYISSIELTDSYRSSWLPYYPSALDSIKGLNANSVILPYTWTFQSDRPVWLSPNPASDPSVSNITQISTAAHEKGLKVYLKPTIQYSTSPEEFWNEFGKTDEDWIVWFESISRFYQQSALLAKQINAQGIILGDEQISQIITESENYGLLSGGYSSNSNEMWNGIFKIVKESSQLPTFLALQYDDIFRNGKVDFNDIDGIYLLNLGNIPLEPVETRVYAEKIGSLLDETLMPIFADTNLKLWIGLDFPSVSYSHSGCITYPTQCNSPGLFNFPAPEQPEIQISLQEQTNLYNAALPEINRRDWISGISSRRFLVTGSYQDQSSSIHGKPASDVIWYWYSQINGAPTE
jgi:hypothetical protein